MRLKDKVALVTGAGSGIGRAVAELFVEEGAFVYVNDVNVESAERVVAGLVDPKRGVAVRADVASSAQVRDMFGRVEREKGRLNVLVNNAGISEVSGERMPVLMGRLAEQMQQGLANEPVTTHLDATLELPDEEWLRMLAVHLNGTFYCTREALKLMPRSDGAAIVNMASVAGLMGLGGSPHYSAAKAGIIGFTRAVAQDVGSRNIRVNAVCPGWIDTPMTQPVHQNPLVGMMIKNRTPLRRFGHPREIATTVLFLASEDGAFMTGQWVSPNGGLFIG